VIAQTFILSFSFAFAQSIAKSVSRCTAARKNFLRWQLAGRRGDRLRRQEVVERFVGPAKLQTDDTAKNA
jgi:hypothetical protein